MKGNREGMVLPLILFLMLALTFFGHGALVMARRELQATWGFRHLVRANQAAEMGLRLGMAAGPGPSGSSPLWAPEPVVSGETVDGLLYSVTVRRLAGGFLLLESRGGSRGWRGSRTQIWVGWIPYPGYRIRSFFTPSPEDSGADPGGADAGSWGSRGSPLRGIGGDVPLADQER